MAPGVGVDANSDGTFTALPNMVAQVVDAEGNSVKAYAELYDALTANKAKSILLSDIQDCSWLIEITYNSNTRVLDLNGHNITFKGNTAGIVVYGASSSAVSFEVTGKGTISAPENTLAAISVEGAKWDDGTVEVTIGKDVTLSGKSGLAIDSAKPSSHGNNNYGITVNIAGTVKSVNNGIGVYVNGLITGQQPVINVMSTARIEADSWGMYLAGNNKTTVASGAQISGTGTGIEIRAGELTLNDCTVTGGSGELWATPKGDGTTVGNAAVAVSQHNTNLPITVTVNGGTYTGTAAFYQFDGRTDTTGTSREVKTSITRGTFLGQVAAKTGGLTITGGAFTMDVNEYCGEGFECTTPTDDDPMYYVVESAADEKVIITRSLKIGNTLTMIYRATLPAGWTDPMIAFEIYNDEADKKCYEAPVEVSGKLLTDGQYEFAFTGINPQRMTDTLKATLKATKADSTTTTYQINDYSVADYCNALLASKANENNTYTELISNLVAYGAASQVYMNYHLDKMVDTVVTGTTAKAYLDSLAKEEMIIQTTHVSGVGVNIAAKTLVLTNSFAVRVYFTLDENVSLNDVSFMAKVGEKEVVYNKDNFKVQNETGRYYFDYAGMNATELDDPVNFTAYVGETAGDTLVFSANSYLGYTYKALTEKGDTSSKLYNIVTTLYNYGYTCDHFATKK